MGKVDQGSIPAAAQTEPSETEKELVRLREVVEELQSKQGNMIPARPGLDLEAKSVGKADGNATTSGTDRSPGGDHLPKTDGPRVGPRREFLPAEYGIHPTVVNAEGKPVTFSQSRRDR